MVRPQKRHASISQVASLRLDGLSELKMTLPGRSVVSTKTDQSEQAGMAFLRSQWSMASPAERTEPSFESVGLRLSALNLPTKIRIKNKRQLWKALYDDERKVVAQMLRDAFNEGYCKWDHYIGPMLRTSIVAIAAIVGIVIFVFNFDFGSYLWNYIFGGD